MGADYSSFQLKDKIAIVTGPSQGIGRAIALGFAQAGAHLVLAEHPALHQEELKEVKAEIESLGRKAVIALTDISKVDQVRAMVDKAVQSFGRLDILVNSARLDVQRSGLGCDGRGLRQDRRFNRERHILCLSGGGSSHDPARRWKDRQYRVELCRLRLERPRCLLWRQG